MPIYEYVCQSCGDDFEKLTSYSDRSVPACPTCHGTSVERQLSTPAIHFKGSGWYINDSKPSTKESINGSTNGNGIGNGKDVGNGKEADVSAKPSDTGKEVKVDASKNEPAKNEPAKGDKAKGNPDTAGSAKSEKKAAAAAA